MSAAIESNGTLLWILDRTQGGSRGFLNNIISNLRIFWMLCYFFSYTIDELVEISLIIYGLTFDSRRDRVAVRGVCANCNRNFSDSSVS